MRVVLFQYNSLSWAYHRHLHPFYQLLERKEENASSRGKRKKRSTSHAPPPMLKPDGVSEATFHARCDYLVDWVHRAFLFHYNFLIALGKNLRLKDKTQAFSLLDTYKAYKRTGLAFSDFDELRLSSYGREEELSALTL